MKVETELKSRVLTVFLGLPLILGLLIYGKVWGTWFVACVLSFLMWIEYASMIYQLKDKKIKKYFVIFLSGVALLGLILFREFTLLVVALVFAVLAVFFVLMTAFHSDEEIPQHVHELSYSFFGILYLTICPMFLPLIRGFGYGEHLLLLFLFMNWGNDIAAYFIGKKFGKHKIFPKISPKKSWEGACAGVLAGIFIAFFYSLFFDFEFTSLQLFILSSSVCITALLGDLLESLLKRSFHMKDSGSLLPGHGGFLDRFDGVLLSAPVLYLCIATFYSN